MSKKNQVKTSGGVVNQGNDKLIEQLGLYKKELFNLRFQQKLGELKNTSRFSTVRKEIAKIKTELVKRSRLGDK